MRQTILSLSLLLLSIIALGQAKKPTIMVVPSDNLCIKNGYSKTMDAQGETIKYPDYQAALQSDEQLRLVITKIGSLMSEEGFPLKDLEQELKKIRTTNTEKLLLTSTASGSALYETPIDVLKRTANADIILDIDFQIKKKGPEQYILFNLKGLDSYTNKQIAGAAGSGAPSYAASADLLIEEAVLSHMDGFNGQLMSFFEDMFENGRETSITLLAWENTGINFENSFNYQGNEEELGFIIEDWLAEHTVNGRYTTTTATETTMQMDQLRIPLFFERNGREQAMDTRRFVNELRNFLKKSPFNIESKIHQRGLGEAWLILGEK